MVRNSREPPPLSTGWVAQTIWTHGQIGDLHDKVDALESAKQERKPPIHMADLIANIRLIFQVIFLMALVALLIAGHINLEQGLKMMLGAMPS